MTASSSTARRLVKSRRGLAMASIAVASAFVLGACSSATESAVTESTTDAETTTEAVDDPAASVAKQIALAR